VLVDREKARFFVIMMGNIEEVSDVFQTPPVKHRSTAGSDHMRSQMVFQRRAATWSGWFLKDVSEILHDIIQKYDVDRVVLAGPEDVTAELLRLLPKAVASRVVDRLRMSVSGKEKEVLDVSFPTIERIEREREKVVVQDLVTMARKGKPGTEKAVLGFNGSLDAINQGRVHRLIHSSGFKMLGFQCMSCDVLLDHAPSDGKCPYCSKPLDAVEDMVWLASERVLNMGGSVDEIRSVDVRSELDAAGSIGAFLY